MRTANVSDQCTRFDVTVDVSVCPASEYVNLQIFHSNISFRDERLFEFRMLDECVYRPGQNHPRAQCRLWPKIVPVYVLSVAQQRHTLLKFVRLRLRVGFQFLCIIIWTKFTAARSAEGGDATCTERQSAKEAQMAREGEKWFSIFCTEKDSFDRNTKCRDQKQAN